MAMKIILFQKIGFAATADKRPGGSSAPNALKDTAIKAKKPATS